MVAHSVPTHGQRCVAAIREHLKATGLHWRELTGEQVAAIIDAMPQDAAPAAADLPPKTPRAPRKRVLMAADDEEWIKSLENEPALAGIDIRKELGICQFHFRNAPFKVSRQRFENWLKNAMKEKPVGVDGAGKSSFVRSPAAKNDLPEPDGWSLWLSVNRPECIYIGQSWYSVSREAKIYIRQQMGIT